jgi:hypothetical protein
MVTSHMSSDVQQDLSGLRGTAMSGLPENTVQTTMLHPSGIQGIPSGRSTLKHQENCEEFTEIKFSQVSVRICIHNQLITQSERI